MNKILNAAELEDLLSPECIRRKANQMFEYCLSGKSFFEYHPDKLKETSLFVLDTIYKNYPDLKIPFHSRWGHFRVGGIQRDLTLLAPQLLNCDLLERARTQLDLVICSVLLDAGAGTAWKYQEADKEYSRSEGLGVASFHLFLSGKLSADSKSLKAEAEGLRNLTQIELEKAFQVTEKNPLVGVAGRLKLLNNLAAALDNQKYFKESRPGNILDYLISKYGMEIPAKGIFRAVLDSMGSIWPGRIQSNGVHLGDVWAHSKIHQDSWVESLVPFHKLSQWMTYSLIEPIEGAGCRVSGVAELTGLAEYRNGGLMLDSTLLTLKDPTLATQKYAPDHDLIIEWRSLTIHLLDLIANEIRTSLSKTSEELPLAKVLEGGTWWAGRALANKKRVGATPPLQIESDGTVF